MKKTLLTISTAAVISFGGMFVGSEVVNAETLDQVKKEQKEVKANLSKAEKKIADVLFEIEDLGVQINKIEAEINKANKEIKSNEKQVKGLQEEVDALNKEIEQREEILKQRLSAYQDSGGHLKLTDALFGTESIVDVYGKIETAVAITNSDQDLMLATANDKAVVEQKQMDIEVLNEELEKENKKNKERKAEKKAQDKTLQSKKKKVENQISKLENKSSELTALQADIERSLAAPIEPVVAVETVSNNNESSNNDSSNNDSSNNETDNETTATSSNNNEASNNAPSTSTTASSSNNNGASNNTTATSSNNNGASNNTTTSANNNTSNNTASATTAPAPKKESKPKSVPYTGGGGSAIAAGKQFIGKSTYSLGAQNPSTGTFDCSGFVQWAYKQEGVNLPRTAGAMAGVGQKVAYSDAKPGDLVFFRGGGHVGIYLGGGKFIGSQSSTAVAIADMNSGYWKQHFDGNVRRVK